MTARVSADARPARDGGPVAVTTGPRRHAALREALHARMRSDGVLYGGDPVPCAPVAVVLPRAQWRRMAEVAAVLCRALQIVCAAALESPARRTAWRLGPAEDDVVRRARRGGDVAPLVRFDCAYDGRVLRVLEVNTIFAGLAPSDRLAELVLELDETLSAHEIEHAPLTPVLARLLGSEQARAPGETRSFALVGCGADDPIRAEYAYTVARLETHGLTGSCATFGELRAGPEGSVRAGARDVGAIYLRGTFGDALAALGADAVLADALAGGRVAVVNPVVSLLADSKAALAAIRAPECRALLSRDERALLDLHVPETFVVPADTERDSGGLLDTLASERERYVLKPADGFGGTGITVGRECSPSAWIEHVRRARALRYVAQRYVPHSTVAAVRGRGAAPMRLNVNLVAARGRLAGGFARWSPHAVVNIARGGAMLPLYAAAESA